MAFVVLAQITRRHYAHEPAFTAAGLSQAMLISEELVEEVLGALETREILKQTADDPPAWLVSVPPEETRIADIVERLRSYRPPGSRAVVPPGESGARSVRETIEGATRDALGERTLKSLALDESVSAPPPGVADPVREPSVRSA